MTIKEIAKIAGVSISTVSKIINGKDEHINPQTRTRVLQIVKEYNFTPYASVKQTSSTKKFLLGVLLSSASRSPQMLDGILKAAQECGYGILLLESQDDPDKESRLLTVLSKNQVDGILWEPVSEHCEHYLEELHRLQIPFYFLDRPDLPRSFEIDFELLGYTLTQKLTEKNHGNIACFLRDNSYASNAFLNGFQKCLYEKQLLFSEGMVFAAVEESFIQKLIQYEFTGAVCFDYRSAYLLYDLIIRHHYQIPSDFSLVCLAHGKQEFSTHAPLSCIRIPYYEFGYAVCRNLIHLCEKTDTPMSDTPFSVPCTMNHEKSISQPSFLQKKSFISIGSIHRDIFFTVTTLPQPGSTLKIHNAADALGGKGANQAVGIAKLGHPIHLIGAIGNDLDAAFILNALEAEHISSQGICRNRKKQTGKAYIYTDAEGESAVTVLSGANDDLSPQDIIDNRHLFLNACFCLISSEIPLDTILCAARTAHENHVTTIFKPSTLPHMPQELYSTIDILIPNKKEAAALCPEINSVEQQAEYFFQKGIPTVIITLGHDGCYLKTADLAVHYPAVHFETVDTTGGADAFISALGTYLFEGYPLTDAVQIATLAAAFCVSRQGGAASLIDRQSLDAYIAKVMPPLVH